MGERNYDAANERLIAREERLLDRKKEKLEAAERSMQKTIAKVFEKNKQQIAKDALEATRHPERIDDMVKTAGDGAYAGYGEREVITGKEERVWERDGDE